MKILINMATLKAGGGQNVGLNFLASLGNDINDYLFVLAENSYIHSYFANKHLENYVTVSKNPIKRFFQEQFNIRKFIKKNNIKCVYTYFGVGFFGRRVKHICGVADSNLFFPEIDFWIHYRGFQRLKKKLIDAYRLLGYKKASGLIFENKSMFERANQILKKETKSILILPSFNPNYNDEDIELPFQKEKNQKICLFLCGWQLNKNIMLIPEIAREFLNNGLYYHFILTAPLDNSNVCSAFLKLTEKYNVGHYVHIIGSVKKEQIKSLYSQSDYVFLLSKLESFSNNIIEAWYFKKPLVISNEKWARSICEEAAIYVNRDDPKNIYNELVRFEESSDSLTTLVENGTAQFLKFPNIKEKTRQELSFIRSFLDD